MSANFDKLIEQTFKSLISEQTPEDDTELGSDTVQQNKGRAEQIAKDPNATPQEKELQNLQNTAAEKQDDQISTDIEDLKQANKELDNKAKN